MLQITSCIMNSSKSFHLRISHLPPSYKLYTQQGYVTFCRCQCGQCTTEHLLSALEYRCCWEVLQARRQLVFDGSILSKWALLCVIRMVRLIAAKLGNQRTSKLKVVFLLQFGHHHFLYPASEHFFHLPLQFWQ